MKKLFTPIALFILAGILFSSCSNISKMSITKRHYRSGYYVDFGGSKPTPSIAKVPARTKHQIEPVVTAKVANSQPVIANSYIGASVESGKIKKVATLPKIQIVGNKIVNSTATNKSIFIPNTDGSNNITANPGLENKQSLSATTNGGDSAGGAALSLLWLVIVVILILWLIGLLAFSPGPLFNLLLVLALILLILWLLRIL